VLEVKEISVAYGKRPVLHEVSLVVKANQFVSIIGANANGKTTLINTISGLIKPLKGRIFFENNDITPTKPHKIVLSGIVQVPEGRKIFPNMTVYENLLLGAASVRKDKVKRLKNLESIYDLFPVLNSRKYQIASTLSGGEQQMLAIGRGLMSQPKLLMMDEPSLGLAPLLVEEMFGVISELKRQGMTIFLVEQNVKHSLRLCDYAYVIENGRIVLSGLGQELLENEHTKKAYLGM
jgi:branched-chain amino acid transport system ATP-binding protein